MTMHAVIASVPTEHGSRYLQQLCKHWSHKMPVEFNADAGSVKFPSGAILTMTAQAGTLDVRLDLPEGEDAGQMEGVVATHLDRFAFREAPLSFHWVAI
jgi:hypothetical protein